MERKGIVKWWAGGKAILNECDANGSRLAPGFGGLELLAMAETVEMRSLTAIQIRGNDWEKWEKCELRRFVAGSIAFLSLPKARHRVNIRAHRGGGKPSLQIVVRARGVANVGMWQKGVRLMTAASLLVVIAATGVSFGWQPLSDGTLEYVIQIEPSVAESMLRNGDAVLSDVPSNMRNGSRIRVQISPNAPPANGTSAPGNSGLRSGTPAGVSFGWQPTNDGSQEYFVQLDPTRAATMLRTGDPISVDIPANLRGGRRVRIQVGSAEVPGANLNSSGAMLQPPMATSTGSTWPSNGFNGGDDRRRWNSTEFGVTPDDPRLSTGSVEPYRPLTPSWGSEPSRARNLDYGENYRLAGRPTLGAEMMGLAPRPSISRSDTAPLTNSAQRSVSLNEVTERPWMALTMTALMLFASLGANLYLGWLARDYYLRYREMTTGESML